MDAASASNAAPDADAPRPALSGISSLSPVPSPSHEDDDYGWLGYESAQPHAWMGLASGDDAGTAPQPLR